MKLNPLRSSIYLAFTIFIVLIFYNSISRFIFWQTGLDLVQVARPYSQETSTSTLPVLFIGDSTAIGIGASNNQDSIAGRFGQDCPNAEIVNQGKNGDRVPRLEQRFVEEGQRFNLVFVQIGGNDVLHFTPINIIEQDLREVLARAQKIGRRVVLLSSSRINYTPFIPWLLDGVYRSRADEVEDVFARIATEKGATFISSDFLSDEVGQREKNSYFAQDRFHPNDNGYDLWYQKIKSILLEKKLLRLMHLPDGTTICAA